tara:strand:+ start:1646 stop:2146 length:501 start_codon:yes stop_codon:yes gene_type:complete
MDGFNKYVLFYSTQCQFCVKLLKIIEDNGLTNTFNKINIDFTDDIPSFVTTVPTILVDKNTKISGQAVFEWIQKQTESTQLQPASISEMSDPYSFISSNGDQNIHTRYSLLDCDYGGGPSAGKGRSAEPERIPKGNIQSGAPNNDDLMQRIMDSRSNEVPQMIRRV